jgi:hypothetical protein
MDKVFSGIVIAGIIAIGAWMKLNLPNADKYDPHRNPLAAIEIVRDAAGLFSSNETKELQNDTVKVNQSNSDQITQTPINDEFKKELLDFYTSKNFSRKYSAFIENLIAEKEIVFYPTVRSYINKLVANDIDNDYFSITVYLTYEDKKGAPVIVPSTFIADKMRGSPIKNIFQKPGEEETVEIQMPDEWSGFTLYDVGLFGLISYKN